MNRIIPLHQQHLPQTGNLEEMNYMELNGQTNNALYDSIWYLEKQRNH